MGDHSSARGRAGRPRRLVVRGLNRLLLAPVLLLVAGCGTVLHSAAALDTTQVQALEAFDYSDWTAVLESHVDDQGRVNYEALLAAREPLDRFVALVGAAGPKTRPELFPTPEHKLAYYVNAYNACTLFNVLHAWPLESVNDSSVTFFMLTKFKIDGEELSLYALENDVVRPRFKEPRAHFALNCASAGCPRLPNEPFLPESLEAQLARETERFLHEARNVSREGDAVVLSQIFEWYADDFSPSPLAWIASHAPDLGLSVDADVEHRPYDWSLNRQ